MTLPPPIDACATDLTAPVRAILDVPPDPGELRIEADGITFVARTWGDPSRPPLLLVHGITSSSDTFWRIGPALGAGLERYVVAPDQLAHGRTARWTGKISFRDNAGSIAAFIRASGIDRPDLAVVGHSWGGLTVAELPAAGIRPAALVLLDPPAVPRAAIAAMLDDPVERHYDDPDEALRAMAMANPTWAAGDVVAKAAALTEFDELAVRAILTQQVDWDGGLSGLRHPAAAGVRVRLVRGDPAAGGLVLDAAAEAFGELIGDGNVLTIVGGTHSPMRNRVESTMVALLRALDPGSPA